MHLTINPLIFLYFLILDSISIVFTTLSTLFLDEHVVETIALQKIDIGIDGSIAPVEECLGVVSLVNVLKDLRCHTRLMVLQSL